MKVILIICAASLVTSKSTDEVLSPIIIGDEAKPKQFPYQVFISLFRKDGLSGCGGALLSDLWVVTAAHCTVGVKQFHVYLGITDKSKPLYEGQQKVRVDPKNMIVHEHYKARGHINDIALIKFPWRVKLNDFVKPARLPPRNGGNYDWRKAITSGWGATTPKEIYQNKLLWTEVPIFPVSECNRYIFATGNHICTQTINGRTPCKGDSGGPLVLADGSYTLIGIVSNGPWICIRSKAAVYTRISSYLGWIHKKTGGQLGSP